MSHKRNTPSEEFPIFKEVNYPVVEFESTWDLENVFDKAVPIPTQTDPVQASVNKAINTSEYRNMTIQTEPWFNAASTIINEKRLADSLRVLAPLMEIELRKGTTTVFKFSDS